MPEMLLTKETPNPKLTIFQSDMGAARPFVMRPASR